MNSKQTGLVASCLVVALCAIAPSAVAAPVLSISGAKVNVGDVFTVDVSVTDAVDLTAWQFDLAFDPAIVQAATVTEGPFLSTFGSTVFIPGVIDNSVGLITLTAALFVDLPPLPSGSGVLAQVAFEGVGTGTSPLTISNAFLNFSDQDFTVESGQAVVPEPATLILLGSGFALLGSRRVIRLRRSRFSSIAGSTTSQE